MRLRNTVPRRTRHRVRVRRRPTGTAFSRPVRRPVRTRPPALPQDVRPYLRRLTAREQEVVGPLAEGLSNAEIAERLLISEDTLKAHLATIRMKFGGISRSGLKAVLERYKVSH